MPKIVIFFHRGDEASLKRGMNRNGGTYLWKKAYKENMEKELHSRKSVVTNGVYVHNGEKVNAELNFWCEYEASSNYKRNQFFKKEKTKNEIPDYFHWPIMPKIDSKNKCFELLNTDPCVFGDRFKYCNCYQGRSKKLKNLQTGDLIIFGASSASKKAKRGRDNRKKTDTFILDTVFVVKESYKDFLNSYIPNGEIPFEEWYYNLTVRHLHLNDNFTLYFGANYESQYTDKNNNNLYSFFPCKEYTGLKNYKGFKRPELKFNDRIFTDKEIIIKDGSCRVPLIYETSHDEISNLWREIRDKVLESGLLVGIESSIV